jgi:hypothetical protein
VFEFWEEKYLGLFKDRVTLSLAPGTTRVLIIHPQPKQPQVIATNLHLLGGYHEIKKLSWDEKQLTLSGVYQRAPGLEGKVFVYVPDGFRPLLQSPRSQGSALLTKAGPNLWVQEVRFKQSQLDWTIPFESARRP